MSLYLVSCLSAFLWTSFGANADPFPNDYEWDNPGQIYFYSAETPDFHPPMDGSLPITSFSPFSSTQVVILGTKGYPNTLFLYSLEDDSLIILSTRLTYQYAPDGITARSIGQSHVNLSSSIYFSLTSPCEYLYSFDLTLVGSMDSYENEKNNPIQVTAIAEKPRHTYGECVTTNGIDLIFLIGGWDVMENELSDQVQIFNVTSGEWIETDNQWDLEVARMYMACGYSNYRDALYTFGGSVVSDSTRKIYRLPLFNGAPFENASWSLIEGAHLYDQSYGAIALPVFYPDIPEWELFYILGGRSMENDGSGTRKNVDILSLNTEEISNLQRRLDRPRGEATSAILNSYGNGWFSINLFGGYNESTMGQSAWFELDGTVCVNDCGDSGDGGGGMGFHWSFGWGVILIGMGICAGACCAGCICLHALGGVKTLWDKDARGFGWRKNREQVADMEEPLDTDIVILDEPLGVDGREISENDDDESHGIN